MAVLSDYTSGTISLANGSATVTGTGTLFEVTRFREGDTLQIQNLTAVIASVDSDTQLTLTEPWTGTSIVDGPYRARQLADGTRVGTQAAALIELLGDGTLAGLAALGVEEGKAPVGGPAGQYVLADMVTDPNGSLGKLAALTLAARQILQTDAAGDLKQVALAANKLLRTDANADIAQSDITAAAIALLNLSGTAAADRLPYLTGASGAGLTALTAFARTALAANDGYSMWQAMGGATVSGTFKLPGGWLFQFTRSSYVTDSGGYAAVTWPTAFGNTEYLCWSFLASSSTGSPVWTIWNTSQGLSQANVYCENRSSNLPFSGQAILMQSLAIGKAP
ncbi:Conserved hypothetical protein [Brucella intermedia LMG 3301]|uniref:Tail fiber protein n=1 Tax=Brucella intermedia LMG 3301 TaxID=641118 RepID=C4WNB4_9HYPH|nr:hypothetical protein [Brucella intermedia]EEQ93869.1 Conserved hypothetical protein [Brucella intermedia LMG 3301]SUA86646.1 Uncharacterised protein [Brucella intermedia]